MTLRYYYEYTSHKSKIASELLDVQLHTKFKQ